MLPELYPYLINTIMGTLQETLIGLMFLSLTVFSLALIEVRLTGCTHHHYIYNFIVIVDYKIIYM